MTQPSPQANDQPLQHYEICVEGVLDTHWGKRLNGMHITHEGQTTILRGFVIDQAALMGILNALYNLQYPLIHVRRDVRDTHSP